MDFTPLLSKLRNLAHMSEMNEALDLVIEALKEDLEDQVYSGRAQASHHLATAVELKYQEKSKRLEELKVAILQKKIENEGKEDTSPEYKQTKLDNFISTLLNQACKELLDAIYNNGSDNAKEMRLQMVVSSFHYYTLQIELYYLAKSGAASELGTALDLDDNAPLSKVIPESLSCLEGIDVEKAILRENFDGSVTLELCKLNYTDNSDWLLDLLSQSGSKFDFVKVTSKEGFSALKGDFLRTLVTACLGCQDAILHKIPRYISIGFSPSLDWETELFSLFKPLEKSMTIENSDDIVSGALVCVDDVKHNAEAMKIIVYFGFEEKKEPFKKINCFEMFRVSDPDDTIVSRSATTLESA